MSDLAIAFLMLLFMFVVVGGLLMAANYKLEKAFHEEYDKLTKKYNS